MKFKVQVVTTSEDGEESIRESARLGRATHAGWSPDRGCNRCAPIPHAAFFNWGVSRPRSAISLGRGFATR